MMPKNIRERFVQSSGNVYADLGLANPEGRRAKALLMRLERLFEILHELGGEVRIVARVGGKTETVSVFS